MRKKIKKVLHVKKLRGQKLKFFPIVPSNKFFYIHFNNGIYFKFFKPKVARLSMIGIVSKPSSVILYSTFGGIS